MSHVINIVEDGIYVSFLEEAARIKPRTWYHDEKQVVHVACSPYETDKTHVKRQPGRGRKNVSSRRESFVLVIVCRGRASAINAKREHKGPEEFH